MNTEKDYKKTVTIDTDIALVYIAITKEINEWWGTNDGNASDIHNIFKIKFSGESYWKFKIIDLVENESVVWKCIESNQDHNIKGMDEEWLNSTIIWNLSKREEGCIVIFQHNGLKPSGVCYDACATAWDFYLVDSLKNYLETGIGKPNMM